MSYPPALTWLHLFRADANCAPADGVPAWLSEMLKKHASGSGPNVRVVAGKQWHELSDLPAVEALVAINCKGVTTDRLREAGFGYARRFAVVPSLQNARWFISLDTPAVAASSFNLYTPARLSAHIKRSVAQTAARLRLPGWYRDQIVIAQRKTLPPLEEALARVFPTRDLRLALSAGAPEPAKNRKASAAVIATNGEQLGFVKIADTAISRRIVEHEASILPALESHTSLRGLAPRLIHAGEVDGKFIAVQAPLPGKPASAKFGTAHQLFLSRLRIGPNKPAAETRFVRDLDSRLASLTAPPADVTDTFEHFRPILEELSVPATIIHGDFAPWNLRIHQGRISAFDWEYGEVDGLPLIDETHYQLQVGTELHGWDALRAAQYLHESAMSRPLNLAAPEVRALQAVYLLDNVVRLLHEGYAHDHELVAKYRALMTKLVASAPREAALV
jgi:hypothetical protein